MAIDERLARADRRAHRLVLATGTAWLPRSVWGRDNERVRHRTR